MNQICCDALSSDSVHKTCLAYQIGGLKNNLFGFSDKCTSDRTKGFLFQVEGTHSIVPG